jgi:transcriptional regulator GlxA family with amidase domain
MATRVRSERLRVAVVAYQGVLADESWAFHDVFSRVPDVRVLTVGHRLGVVGGPGGAQRVEVTFESVGSADIVAVPGGLGSHRHPEISAWIRRIEPRWVLTSSTGSALLAAGGLLRGRTAATHWLAGPLLERHGVIVSPGRLVVDGPYVTCTGLASAYDAAYVVVRAVGGPELVSDIRRQLAELREPAPPSPVETITHRPRPRRPTAMVEVELEETPRRR